LAKVLVANVKALTDKARISTALVKVIALKVMA
jgi:hypothetical protein